MRALYQTIIIQAIIRIPRGFTYKIGTIDFGEPKVLLQRLDEEAHPSPKIVLGAIENNIEISIACYPDTSSQSSSQTTIPKAIIHKCAISNFPLQAWVNLIISLYGRTLDVYVDGKLVRTCVLPGVAMVGTKQTFK